MTITTIAQKSPRVRHPKPSPEALRARAAALRSDFPRPVRELARLELQRYADNIESARRLETEAVERELQAAVARRARRRGRR